MLSNLKLTYVDTRDNFDYVYEYHTKRSYSCFDAILDMCMSTTPAEKYEHVSYDLWIAVPHGTCP